jgi:signal transduction histidine kinase/CheY-like chemotaxis protein
MLEILNLALGILVFGGAATLVGLSLLLLTRGSGGGAALGLLGALAALGAATAALLGLLPPLPGPASTAAGAAAAVALFAIGAVVATRPRPRVRLRSELGTYFVVGLIASAACAVSAGLLAGDGLAAAPGWRLALFGLLPVLLLGIPLAPLVSRRVAGPIEVLSEHTKPLTKGELEGFQGVRSGDEIEQISDSIRVMVGAVQRNRDDLQEQLSRLQDLDKLRQQFLANVSHELRTPLTMILGNTDILLEEILGKLGDEQKDFLRTVHEQGQVLHQLIGDVLAFADIKAGRAELHVKDVAVRELILSVLQRFTPLMRHKRLKVQGKLPDVRIAADPDKLRQVLTHLVSNAVKFSRKEGQIVVQILPGNAAKGEPTRFEVVDNGLGIAKGQLARIFDTFYQVDGTSTREHGGTGIGLTIVKHYVEMHGGKVDIQSEAGKGTAVRFDLPARPLPRTAGPLPQPKNVRVLLASTDNNLARILKTYLVQGGFDVFSVAEAEKIESEAERLHPGLVLLDADSDDEALWKALESLRAGDSQSMSPPAVLVVSTRLSRSTAESRGASNFLELPADYDTFIRSVKTVAATSR